MPLTNPQIVFKVAPRTLWEQACQEGVFCGSDVDRRDGFIHLSAPHQLVGTLTKHFAGQTDLLLISFNTEALGDALRWEPSRGGELFPHLYADLPTSAADKVHALSFDSAGAPILPESVGSC